MQDKSTKLFFMTLLLFALLPELSAELTPCPNSPNCVSSQAQTKDQKVESLFYKGDPDQALAKLEQCLIEMEGVNIELRDNQLLHTTFTTKWLKFIDDVHFLLQPDQQRIEIRSASREGYWDLGTNRRRVNRIAENCQPLLLLTEPEVVD